jgi:hypothetical protein
LVEVAALVVAAPVGAVVEVEAAALVVPQDLAALAQ